MNGSADLVISELDVTYGQVQALRGVALCVPAGGFVTVLGSNGAGKTTLARTTAGSLTWHRGQVRRGSIRYGDFEVTAHPTHDVVRAGIAMIPEGRRVFAGMTVEENLRVGATMAPRHRINALRDEVFDLLPKLATLCHRRAGFLSGGEQQMLAIGRALMSAPSLLICDELSLGLAPIVIRALLDALRTINTQSDTSVLLVEQNVELALAAADYGYVLEVGELQLEGLARDLMVDERVAAAYLGTDVEPVRQ